MAVSIVNAVFSFTNEHGWPLQPTSLLNLTNRHESFKLRLVLPYDLAELMPKISHEAS